MGIKRITLIIMNYIDLALPLEDVLHYRIDKANDISVILLRVFDNIIAYFLIYGIAKFIQFILSVILSISMERIGIGYIFLPYLLLIEIGYNKLDIRFPYILFLLVRVPAKYIFFYFLDMLILSM